MKRTNKYLDNLVTKILNETLEEKANEIMEKLHSDEFDYVAEGETCECGSKEFYEGMCVDCGTMKEGKGDILEKDCMEGSSGCMGEGKTHELELDEFEDEDWFRETDRISKDLDKSRFDRPKKPIRRKERNLEKDDEFDVDFNLKFDDEDEMVEGNAFTDALRKTPKGGKFKLGGKEYTDTSSLEETFLYRLSDEKGSELFTEEEIIDLIENIIVEEEKKRNIKKGQEPKGLTKYREAHKGSGKENSDYLKSVAKKMTDYIKDGSKGKYETNPKHFPKGNGQLAKMDKMAYEIPEEGKKFNLDISGLNIPDYDEIMPDKKKIRNQIEGDNLNANNPEWANAEDTGVNKMFADIFDEDPLGKLKDDSYKRYDQPVVLNKSKKSKSKKGLNMNEEFDRMKGLISYDRKTQ